MTRFSSRLGWETPPNRLSMLLEELRRAGRDVIDLTESNPTRVGLACPAGGFPDALADPRSLHYEPAPRGLPEARSAVARWLGRRGVPADPERIVLTSGTSEAYSHLFKILLDPGEAVLVPRPSYPLLDLLAPLESVRLRPYALARDGRFRLDPDSLREAAGPGARAVVVIHPNNPTGSFLSREEARGVRELCRERDLALISDEVFLEYALSSDPRREPTLAGDEVLTFCLGGLSKSAGLPQAKLGWIWVGGPPAERRRALERLDLVADTFLSVGGAVQHALPILLERGEEVRASITARLRENLAALSSAVARAPECTLLPPEGGWAAVLRLPSTRSDEEWALELLRHEAVRVQPGYFYDFEEEAVMVLSLLPDPSRFRDGVERILRRLRAG